MPLAVTALKAFSYDAMGNTLSNGELSFSYNQAGRLATATKTGMSASYVYNAQQLRVKKTVNGVARYYICNLSGQCD